MKLNEKTVFKVPPEFAYGEKGSGNIPENETLYFEAELLSIKEKEKEITDYSQEERIVKGLELKEEGNRLFKESKNNEALEKWAKSLEYYKDLEGDLNDLRVHLLNNQAIVHLKLKNYTQAIKLCD